MSKHAKKENLKKNSPTLQLRSKKYSLCPKILFSPKHKHAQLQHFTPLCDLLETAFES